MKTDNFKDAKNISNKSKARIYLDYASSTPLHPEVKKAMEPFWSEDFGNAGSRHEEGMKAEKSLKEFRGKIAGILNVKKEEIIFTSGGTESNSLAIIGFLNYLEKKKRLSGKQIITTEIEHPSVLEIFKEYEKKGLDVSFTPIFPSGFVDLKKLSELSSDKTILVSIAYVNSEIGVIQPLKKIKNLLLKKNTEIIFHTDASQAPLYLQTRPESLGVDMMSLDGQKIYGPKGIGLLYKNNKVKISPIFLGGTQEKGLRPGTENVPLIAGLSKALEIAEEERPEASEKVSNLRNYFFERLLSLSPRVTPNGSREFRIANNVNISVKGESGEMLILKLNQKGISATSKSACMEESEENSYVLKALGGGESSGVRFTLGKETTKEEIDKTVLLLKEIIGT
ncbi:cysteine desulfurase NifS [Candidatus Campbellbacteria bacterium CG11_big_fil_rev_8_21_14_0_20_44_21]|uniref:Cysteine desulfurase NifS n=1 Tax=Candidatus Campbellbacteria bacterium CG22_combo_CG10-13_8_21_14_all_43_18 TaxID=1974530 RepID=A0A2H0DWG1_9BACT|nr:MAG: cysteine desulfurase NifS [Candidatus Campbellbacteria bacterium CG22_combo_CG10-13_8_21_14_all_43_18]PIR24124.1 MAG: cysteine desulfurase NifS [Candidatus Campbellbacteria bacterium CG11_big_fil_rev_8_21_14_0_20_44_21]